MTSHARKHLTAWLGLVAMWVIVLAPLVSQLVVAHHEREPIAPLCSAAPSSGDSHHGMHDGAAFTACGYCDLLTTHATVPTVPAVSLPELALIVVAAVCVLFIHFTPAGAFPSGRPRAPPAFC
jgi:hypothetical protein